MESENQMKQSVLLLLMAVAVAGASAQTTSKPAVTPAKPASTATKSASTATKPGVPAVKLPPGIPPVKRIVATAFALRYQDIKIGTGADAEPSKLYKINYTGWRAADGVKFDSSYDHPGLPLKDKDGKPVLGEDGKPVIGDPQPFAFPQGMGRVMPGFDQGFEGMKVGGKRRLFIPWQLAYGTRNIPDHPAAHPGDIAHAGIPPKSDLIFDVELVDVSDPPAQPARPGMGGRPIPGAPGAPGRPGTVGAPLTPGSPTTPANMPPGIVYNGAPGSAPKPATPGQPAVPATPAPSPAPSTPPPAAAPPAPATPPATTPPPSK